jgi:hypothetical protein
MADFDGVNLADLVRGLPESLDRTREAMERLTEAIERNKDATEESKQAQQGLFDGFADVKAGIDLARQAIGSAIGIGREWVDVAHEQELANLRLAKALEIHKQGTRATAEEQIKWAGVLQQLTGLDDAVVEGLQTQLLHMGAYGNELNVLTLAALGFSDSHEKSLQSSVQIVGRLLQGNTKILKRYGEDFATAGEALEAFAQRGLEVTDRNDMLGTSVAIAEANFGELVEALGKTITESASVKQNVQDMSFALLDVSNWVTEHGSEITEFWNTISTVTGAVLENFRDNAAFLVVPPAFLGATVGRAIALATQEDNPNEIPAAVLALERRQKLEHDLREKQAEELAALKARLEEQDEERERAAKEKAAARAQAHDDELARRQEAAEERHFAEKREKQARRRDEEYDAEIAAATRRDDALATQADRQAQAEDNVFRANIARRQAYNAQIAGLERNLVLNLASSVGQMIGSLSSDEPGKAAANLGKRVVGVIATSAQSLASIIFASGEAAKQFGNPYLAAAAAIALSVLAGAAQAVISGSQSSLSSPSLRTPGGGGGTGAGAAVGFTPPSSPGPASSGSSNAPVNVVVNIGSGAIVGGDGKEVGRELAELIERSRPGWRNS